MEPKFIILTALNNQTWLHYLLRINKLLLPLDQQPSSFFWQSG